MKEVIRVEQHQVRKANALYNYCDKICFLSKDLYNMANYLLRQNFINKHTKLGLNQVISELHVKEQYVAMSGVVSKCVLSVLDKNWDSFCKADNEYQLSPGKYRGKPHMPKYKKKNGRNVVVIPSSFFKVKDGLVQSTKVSEFKLKTNILSNQLMTVRIVPNGAVYVIELVYKMSIENFPINKMSKVIGIDLGVGNFATIANNIGEQPIVINGKIIKSINQYYNKKHNEMLKQVSEIRNINKRMNALRLKRTNKIKDSLHKISRYIINYCKERNIDTIIIGFNRHWQDGKIVGNFSHIPYNKFMQMLKYKAEEAGIRYISTEESFTSKASFLDLDNIPYYDGTRQKKYISPTFSGERISRGIYLSRDGQIINADVNGAYNIIRKVSVELLDSIWFEKNKDALQGVALHPKRIDVA